MATIQFYHLLHTPLERALPKLMEKLLAGDGRAVVRVGSESQATALSDVLWSYDPASFLPHGTARDGHVTEQPIYITATAENPNGANHLVITDGTELSDFSGYEKILDLFDGLNDAELLRARARFRAYKEAGHSLTYIKQQDNGGWKVEG
jgi:DNA polymerase-3 subunit chi